MAASPDPGFQLEGFEIVRLIGQGGMGEIWEAAKLGAGGFRKAVALKVVNLERGLQEDALKRFLREAEISARLEHRNLVRVHDLLQVGTRHVMVMELLKGRDLYDLRDALGGKVDGWVALSIASQALDGLTAAHRLVDEQGRPLGLVHRDLTPGNIYVTEAGIVKILDFGVAKLRHAGAAALTAAGYVAGTAAFMSPEQSFGKPVDARSDLFQMGATLYYFLSGELPRASGPTREQILSASLPPARPLAELRPDLPGRIVGVVERAMALNPADRFTHAREMKAAVDAALAAEQETGEEALAKLLQSVAGHATRRMNPFQAAAPSSMPADEQFARTVPSVKSEPALPENPFPPSTRQLSVGAVVANRYRIVRFLAQGGMGAVYEVEDQELHERLAMKTVRPDVASARSTTAVERFRREINLARRVTHPNVCRIYDIGHHVIGGKDGVGGQDVLFLTMELLVGETLAERMRRVGRMSPREAQPIVEQMAAGLAAAHRAGVVHRDFKTDNVILVPNAEGQLRAVVSDFGVARALGGGAASLTADEMVGSPAYIAPEQLEGKPITPATDVYALGVVLFEMVTGKLPFEGDNAIGTAMMRLTAPAPAARSVAPGLDARWDQAIRRALEREPAKRFQTVEELVYALLGDEGITSAIAAGRLGTSGPYRVFQRKRRWVAWIVGAVLAASGGAVGYWRLRSVLPTEPHGGGEPAVKVRRSVAVLGFKNLSGRAENAWLSTALAEMLGVEIAASDQIRLVPGENVARARAELGLTDAAQLSEQSLSGLRRVLGADLVVGGSYLALGEGAGGQLRFDARLQRAADAEVIAQVSETGSESGLLGMASAAGAKLREKLGVAAVAPGALAKAQAKLPADPKAARYYAEGLDALHRFDAEQARVALEKAVEADPSWPLAHSQLGEAYLLLGYSQKAKVKAKDALDRSDKLSREDALYVQALYDRAMEDWPKTAEDFRSLVAFFPDNPEYLLELGNSLQKAGKPAEAIAELDRLRKLPPPASQDPRIDLAEASSAEVQSDFKRMQRASAAAADKAMASGARLLLARARISEGWAVAHLGSERPTAADDALKLFDEARRLCAEVNDRACLAEALNVIGTALSSKNDEAAALKAYRESLEIRRAIGDRSGMLDVSNNMALSQEAAGDAAGAMETFQVALGIAREMGYAPALAKILGNIGQQELRHGDYAAGMAHTEEGSKLLRQVGDNRSYYITVNILQTYSYGAGELATSRRWAEEYISFAKAHRDWWKAAMMVKREGDMARDEGDLPLARRRYQESAALSAQETDKKREGWWTYEVEVSLVELELDEGAKPEAVEPKARALLERFEKKGEKLYASWSKVLVAESLRRQNKLAEAHQLLDPIAAKFHPLESGSDRPLFAAELAYPRLLLADGKRPEAVAAAQKSVEMVAGKKWLPWSLEARLMAGEVELGAGRKVEGRARLLAVKKDAEAKHLGRYAARAAALLGK